MQGRPAQAPTGQKPNQEHASIRQILSFRRK
jgi:hypothetical protein